MKKITALRTERGRSKRVKVLLDGKPAFSLEAEVAAQEVLEVGQELSDSQIEALAESDRFQRCLKTAARYLSYRPRSESELRGRLHQRGFDEDSIATVLTKLKKEGLVDDMTFAQFWRNNQEIFNPRSQRLIRLELKRKGVAEDIIDQVVETVNDNDSAHRAALNKARRLSASDYQSFRRRLGEYLKRRGFSYAVINHTVEQLWQELNV